MGLASAFWRLFRSLLCWQRLELSWWDCWAWPCLAFLGGLVGRALLGSSLELDFKRKRHVEETHTGKTFEQSKSNTGTNPHASNMMQDNLIFATALCGMLECLHTPEGVP